MGKENTSWKRALDSRNTGISRFLKFLFSKVQSRMGNEVFHTSVSGTFDLISTGMLGRYQAPLLELQPPEVMLADCHYLCLA